MGKDFLASKIAAGHDASPKATWWFRHCHSLARYLVFTGMGKAKETAEVRQEALDLAEEWDRRSRSSMKAHVLLELGLIDAARKRDIGEVESIGRLISEEMEKQVRDLGAAHPDLPVEHLRRLLGEHIALFVERVEKDIDGEDRKECVRKSDANAMGLTQLTVEWF